MSKHVRDLFEFANLGRDQAVVKNAHVVAKNDQDDAFQEQILRLCLTVWPGETVQQLAVNAKISVRQAQRLIGREQGFSGKVIRRLCHCHYGAPFLQLWMHGCDATHWLTMLDDHEVCEIERRSDDLKREAEELKRRRGSSLRGGRA
ncbi:hypothetical protein RA307_26075 [Xanthobacteraceae bacterium Astr-EGSB]|uniref:hypothetical protein n=1 Tax=Astrobacterium formosum TaxID=3069710 RepID=UPI0027B1FE3D|nr:hypothetical protein [Xanthobacteraceae bacterium Astr-EGSB]